MCAFCERGKGWSPGTILRYFFNEGIGYKIQTDKPCQSGLRCLSYMSQKVLLLPVTAPEASRSGILEISPWRCAFQPQQCQ